MVFLVGFFVQPRLMLRSVPLLAIPIAVLFMVGSRLAVRLHREHRYRPDYTHAQRVIIYGAGLEGQQLLRLMLSDPDGGFLPVALLDDNQVFRRRRISGVAVHGTRHDIARGRRPGPRRHAGDRRPDAAARVLREVAERGPRRRADREHGAGAVRPAAAAARAAVPGSAAGRGGSPRAGGPARPAGTPEPTPGRRCCRPARWRAGSSGCFDLVVCLLAMLVVLPLLIVIAICAEDRQRPGALPRAADRARRQAVRCSSSPRWRRRQRARDHPAGDARITPVGRWLRASKLDELPQIFNVIKGDMSIVGPRPEDPRYVAAYTAEQRRVLSVRPGMTSLAFLRVRRTSRPHRAGRTRPTSSASTCTEILPEKLDIELQYVRSGHCAGICGSWRAPSPACSSEVPTRAARRRIAA